MFVCLFLNLSLFLFVQFFRSISFEIQCLSNDSSKKQSSPKKDVRLNQIFQMKRETLFYAERHEMISLRKIQDIQNQSTGI